MRSSFQNAVGCQYPTSLEEGSGSPPSSTSKDSVRNRIRWPHSSESTRRCFGQSSNSSIVGSRSGAIYGVIKLCGSWSKVEVQCGMTCLQDRQERGHTCEISQFPAYRIRSGLQSPRPVEHLSIERPERYLAELGSHGDECTDGRALRSHVLARVVRSTARTIWTMRLVLTTIFQASSSMLNKSLAAPSTCDR